MYSGLLFLAGIHALLAALIIFGAVAALMWMYKFADKHLYLKVIVITIAIGVVGMFIMGMFYSARFGGMMSSIPGGPMNQYFQNK